MAASVVRELDRERGAASVARGCVRDLFRALGETEQDDVHVLVSDVELVVSELVTNAVLHGTGRIILRLWVIDGLVSVVVHDDGQDWPRVDDVQVTSEGGRGMAVVAERVSEWGVRSDGTGGKEVWALLCTEPALDLTPPRP